MAQPKRVVAYIDGFNLYHSIKYLNQNHLKWLDLQALITNFAPSPDFVISKIFYFTAFAFWLPQSRERHEQYVNALFETGVTPIIGRFKKKDRNCRNCGVSWVDHEEKESDVSLGISLVIGALQNNFDRAILLTRDSDLVPAVKMARKHAPTKEIFILSPQWDHTPSELIKVAGGRGHHKKIKPIHLERSLLPKRIQSGSQIIMRPNAYGPPEK